MKAGERLREAPVVEAVLRSLEDRSGAAWLVGGGVRDACLGREVTDVDVVVDRDPEEAARILAAGVAGRRFMLSEKFGAWRVTAHDGSWQVDVVPLRGGGIEADLGLRDFTINALAVPLELGEVLDPHGGLADLDDGILRAVRDTAFLDDPARLMRLPRLACELGFEVEAGTAAAARRDARRIETTAGERVFAELRAIVVSSAAVGGIELMSELGVLGHVLPEVESLKGVEQNPYHHHDVYGHTLEVLGQLIRLEPEIEPFGVASGGVTGLVAGAVRDVLAAPLADELTRGEALRFGALMHDVGKPQVRRQVEDGKIVFPGHDRLGVEIGGAVLARLHASKRLTRYVQDLTLNHLKLGFLLKERPLSPRAVFRYITTCEPVALEVTVLSVADRLATRGQKTSAEVIAAHLELAAEMAGHILAWRREGPPRPPVRGDELAEELQLELGPKIGELLAAVTEATYAGEVETRDQAIACARRLLQGG